MASNITLVPIGTVSPAPLSWLVNRLAQATGWDVVVGEMVPLPVAGYDRRRQQYRASAFITVLRALHCPAAERVVLRLNAQFRAKYLDRAKRITDFERGSHEL